MSRIRLGWVALLALMMLGASGASFKDAAPASVRTTTATAGENPSAANGEITIVLDGESRTLPIIITPPPEPAATQREHAQWVSSKWSPPLSGVSDSPEQTHVYLLAGSLGDGEPFASITATINRRARAFDRGNTVVDSRANGNRPAAMDLASASTVTFTLDEYEVRDTSAFIRGSFAAPAGEVNGTDGAMTGTFWALLPAQCGPTHREWGDPTPSAEGCFPCELTVNADTFISLEECRSLARSETAAMQPTDDR